MTGRVVARITAGMIGRRAVTSDIDALRDLMTLAIDRLQSSFLTPEQIVAGRDVMGLDSQLIVDGTYVVVEQEGMLVGCGGWSRRATLYGGDHSTALRAPRLLDAATEPARIRAMYTHPDHIRRGVGRLVLRLCEDAARGAGFARAELMATLAGEPLYRVSGYDEIERTSAMVGDVAVPLIRMRKTLVTCPRGSRSRA